MRNWTIASFNANSFRARLPIVLEWLHRRQPDVLCLQETKVQDHEFPEEIIREAGYQVVFKGERSYNGVAIISQSSPESVSFGLGGKDPDESRLIAAVIDGVSIVNTYVPQGRDADSEYFSYKLKWFDRLLASPAASPEARALLLAALGLPEEVVVAWGEAGATTPFRLELSDDYDPCFDPSIR